MKMNLINKICLILENADFQAYRKLRNYLDQEEPFKEYPELREAYSKLSAEDIENIWTHIQALMLLFSRLHLIRYFKEEINNEIEESDA